MSDLTFLVVSFHHGLLPLAQRLRSEGHTVHVVVWRKRFEKAWGERLDPALRGSAGEINETRLERLLAQAREGEWVVVSDAPVNSGPHRMLSKLPGALLVGELPGERSEGWDLRLGFWFDGHEVTRPHLLVYDMGLWPGGLGPRQPGGLSLLYPDPLDPLEFLEPLVKPIRDTLVERMWRGLVNVGLGRDPETGGVRLKGAELGWPQLHLDAWLSGLEETGTVLAGEAEPKPASRYTVVLPVSVPPWPIQGGAGKRIKIEGLPPALQGWWFWYDMGPDEERRELWTAGLDGLVGVARGEGRTFERARLRALALAQQIQLPEKQVRFDVGSKVPAVVAGLEESFDLVI